MKSHIKKILLVALCSVFCMNGAIAQGNKTGSHLESSSASPEVVYLSRSDEVSLIRQLLTRGENTQALEAALEYVERLERISSDQETTRKYYAYNALCSVHTSLAQLDEALEACNMAMSLEPEKWSAINNRGTAHLVGGQLREALEDYQLALLKAPADNVGISATIEYNISLVEEKGL